MKTLCLAFREPHTELIFVTGDHSFEHVCVALPKKERQTDCLSLLPFGFIKFAGQTPPQLVRLRSTVDVNSDSFIGTLETLSKLSTRLVAVLLYDRHHDLVIHGLLTRTTRFIIQRQILRVEFLKPMPGYAFVHNIIPKSFTHCATLFYCGQAHLKVIKQTNLEGTASRLPFLFTATRVVVAANVQSSALGCDQRSNFHPDSFSSIRGTYFS